MSIDRLTELSLRVASLEPRVDGTPLRSLGWLEVAAAMAKLPRAGADLIRCMYLDDRHALARTLKRTKVRLCGIAPLSEELAQQLAMNTLQAFMAMRPCVKCGGHGFIHTAGYVELDEDGDWHEVPASNTACDACGGQGFDHVELDAVRVLVGVTAQTWELLVREPFLLAYRELLHLHEEASGILSRRLRG